MKKLLSISLLALLIFNMIGFSVYSLLNTDNNYDESEPDKDNGIVVKLPFSLPYVNNWEGTSSENEELLHGDDFYKVVSQKLANDTLYVHCQYTGSARERFWELVSSYDTHINTSDHAAKNQAGKIMKNLLKEYMSADRKLTFFIIEWLTPKVYPSVESKILSSISNITTPPPNFS